MNGPLTRFFGHLTHDPELRYTEKPADPNNPNSRPPGTPYARARIASNRYLGPDRNAEAIFFDVTFWGRQAESVNQRCRTGSRVYVEGAYSFAEYTRQDGTPGYSHRVSARDLEILTRNEPAAAEPDTAADQPDPEPNPDFPEEAEPEE